VTLYDELLRIWPSPVVALNRAIAVSMDEGPEAGLAALTALEVDDKLSGYRYLHETRESADGARVVAAAGKDSDAVARGPARRGPADERQIENPRLGGGSP
jgi:RNA polymerase sigma-70 factor (ECF subfamily)